MSELPARSPEPLMPAAGAYDAVLDTVRRRQRKRLGAVSGAGALTLAAAVTASLALAGGTPSSGSAEEQLAVASETPSPATPATPTPTASPSAVPSASASASPTSASSGAPDPQTAPPVVSGQSAPGTGGGGGSGGGGGDATVGWGDDVDQIVARQPIFGGSAPCTTPTLSPVRIGQVTTLSGVLGELFSPSRRAISAFVRSQNACGGLNGHPLELQLDDDQGQPDKAESSLRRQAEAGVVAFVGNLSPLNAARQAAVAADLGIPMIGSDLLTSTSFSTPGVFPQGGTPRGVAAGLVDALAGGGPVGMLSCVGPDAGDLCTATRDAVRAAAVAAGRPLAADLTGTLVDPGYETRCEQLESLGARSVILNLDVATAGRVANSCAQQGYRPRWALTTLGVGNEGQVEALGNLGASLAQTASFSSSANNSVATRRFQTAMVAPDGSGFDYGRSVFGSFAAQSWSAGALLVAASGHLTDGDVTSAQLLQGLYEFRGQAATALGGLSPARLTFTRGQAPRVQDCSYDGAVSADGTALVAGSGTPVCA